MGEDDIDAVLGDLDRDSLFRSLADRRRREILDLLVAEDEAVPLTDLAYRIAEREAEVPIPEIETDQPERVYLSLLHNHVRSLADADLVAYDCDAGAVSLTDDAEALAPLLDRLTEDRADGP